MNPRQSYISRTSLFKIMSIAFPFVILCIIELILRLAGYGYNYNLFITSKKHPGYVYMNPDVAKKYFSLQQNATEGLYEPFTIKKKSNTIRIFVLGESTTVGFPYHQSGSFHRMLQYRLQRRFPDKNIEILNLSLTAVNSYTILDFSKQLIPYKPDAILIYLGHNEYYGSLGAGSTSYLGSNPFVINTILFLKDFKVYQLLEKAMNSLKKTEPALINPKKSLMERMVKKQEIPYNSKIFQNGINQFRNNITKIFTIFNDKNIPVFCSNLVCNYKDFEPFISVNPTNTNSITNSERALVSDSTGNIDSAYYYYKKSLLTSPEVANFHYRLAKAALKLRKTAEAKQEYVLAKDLDLLRFRAPEEINKIIEEKSKLYRSVYFVDTKWLFEKNSPDSIIGNNLITEHLHPNLKGYGLMAVSYFQAIKNSGLLDLDWKADTSGNEINNRDLPVTRLDTLYGAIQVQLLKELWPFNQKSALKDTNNINYEERVAGGIATRAIKWEKGYNALFKYYSERDDWFQALKLFESQIPDMPFYDLDEYTMAFQLAEKAKEYETSIFYAHKCLLLSSNFKYIKAIFINYLRLDEPEKAIVFIDKAIQNQTTNVDLMPLKKIVNEIIDFKNTLNTTRPQVPILIKISQKYAEIGNYVAAGKYIQLIKTQDKNNVEAATLEKQIMKRN